MSHSKSVNFVVALSLDVNFVLLFLVGRRLGDGGGGRRGGGEEGIVGEKKESFHSCPYSDATLHGHSWM